MTQNRKPDLSEHDEEVVPFDEVMKKLVEGKRARKKPQHQNPTKGSHNE
jgi:hypothetical protein